MLFLFEQYQHIAVFLAIFIVGEVALLPAVYFSVLGVLDYFYVFLISLVATVSSDIIWYLVGRYLPMSRWFNWRILERYKETMSKLAVVFGGHVARLIILSRFVYGTRIAVQVIAGYRRVGFWRYLIANFIGSLFYIFFIYVVALTVRGSLGEFVDTAREVFIALPIFAVLVVGLHWWLKKVIYRHWFKV